MTHQMKLNPQPFQKIKDRRKTIELRLYDEKRRQIKIGDHIIFANTISGEQIEVYVTALHRFSDFEELYRSLPKEKCGYLPDELQTASPKDMEIYYSKDEQCKHGVLGIEIKLI